jgi:hypothetical protein
VHWNIVKAARKGLVSIMRKAKNNKGLLDKKRFEGLQRDKVRWLRNLSWKKAIQLTEKMMSSPLVSEWKDNFPEDHPIYFKKSLERMHRNAMRRQRYRLKIGTIANEAAKTWDN